MNLFLGNVRKIFFQILKETLVVAFFTADNFEFTVDHNRLMPTLFSMPQTGTSFNTEGRSKFVREPLRS
jgi:hypothetical protein